MCDGRYRLNTKNEDIHPNKAAKILSQEIEKIQAGDRKITIDGAAAVQGLWEDKELVRRFLTETGGLADS